MKPVTEWCAKLDRASPWQDAYAFVEQEARSYLAGFPPERRIATEQLVESLFSEKLARGPAAYVRQRIFKALAALATRGLADCVRRGVEKQNRMGQTIRPWTWGAPQVEFNPEYEVPRTVKACPHCGGQL